MSTNVSLETGKLTDGHRTSFRSTTYRVIYKNTNTITSIAAGICERFAGKITMFLMTSLYGPTLPKYRRHPIENEHNYKAIISQIIMSLVYINVMAYQTIQRGI